MSASHRWGGRPPRRPPRSPADAREDRAHILAAAREAFAEDGATSKNRVAQRAGVGAGTVYRNFPTREALVLAVYQDEVDRILDSVTGLLAEQPPLEALRLWITTWSRRCAASTASGTPSAPHQEVTARTHDPVIAAITALLDAGKRDGGIRDDADPADVLGLTAALWRAAPGPRDRSPRMLGLVLDGLRARPR